MKFPINQEVMRHNLRRILGNDDLTLPGNYMVIDLETTGLVKGTHKIWQVGMYVVEAGIPRYDRGKNIWVATDVADLRAADFEINRRANLLREVPSDRPLRDGVYAQMEAEFINEVTTQGVPLDTVLHAVKDVITACVDAQWPIVGQNSCRFDIPFLEWTYQQAGIDFQFPQTMIIDVGILIKAARLGRRIAPHETPKKFYFRVAAERARGVYYALERYCLGRYSLAEKYGVDIAQAHNAGFDTWLTHLVMKEMMAEAFAVGD